MDKKNYYTFENGTKMPKIGLGTFTMKTDSDKKMFQRAILELNYQHLDTASFYQNQTEIGESLQTLFKKSNYPREKLFITSKLWNHQKNNIEENLKKTLKELQLDYIDCLLIHWPFSQNELGKNAKPKKIPLFKIWKEMENCVKKGLCKNIGLSNFNCQIILDLLTYCEIKPCCNQIELHPFLNQKRLVDFLLSVGIVPVAYCPIGRPYMVGDQDNVLKDSLVLKLAQKYAKSPAQIVLNWALRRGHVVIPKSSDFSRLKENIQAGDFVMDDKDFDDVTLLNRNFRILDPIENSFLDLKYPLFE